MWFVFIARSPRLYEKAYSLHAVWLNSFLDRSPAAQGNYWYSIEHRKTKIFLSRLTPHRITLSALASTLGGIVRPICLAALRLTTNSNFVGCSTGKSAGLAPFRILSTIAATRL